MQEIITREIQDYVARYIKDPSIITKWDEPLVAFAAADDPLFEKLKEVVIDSHSLPRDILPEAQTVISFFLPFPKEVARSNMNGIVPSPPQTGDGDTITDDRRLSSPEWARCYIETNELIKQIGEHMGCVLAEHGEKLVTIPATHNWIEDKLIANWSHRHIAYVAGLGSFGLNNMLITEKGCGGRIGSLITSAKIQPTPRSEEEACLYKHDGSCKKCVRQCVNDALDEKGFDRFRCYAKLMENVEEYKNLGYADVCGKCLVATPCTHADPVRLKLRAAAMINAMQQAQ